ncbi:uncharacterized protein STAUR_3400 [Stigmatella aurantiaca DW4/3-1]|uniref:Uncharacterized protein n=1 Tax=Stigmatella aurantiaca (strain DW4/3-1) TaxID=378806 RepID=E3FZY9_STIAD|nr:uncharacterized protein STAUR_3400 [Stigmatella aurantiaca DW4/3-1]
MLELPPVIAPEGIFFDRKGVLWLGGLENSSIHRYVPGGTYEQVIQDDRLRWLDSLAEGPRGRSTSPPRKSTSPRRAGPLRDRPLQPLRKGGLGVTQCGGGVLESHRFSGTPGLYLEEGGGKPR